MKYKTYTMEDALEAIIDYRGKTPQKAELGIPVLSAKSVKNNHIDYDACYYVSPEEYKRFMVRGMPQIGDVLLTTEAPMGIVARLDRDDVGIAQRLLTLRGKKDILDNEYLLYYLQSPIGQALLRARETGTTVTGIKQSEFRKIQINIPDIETQRKIGGILQALDKKCSINEAINRNLSEQVQAIYKSWFIDFEPFGGKRPINWKILKFEDFIKLRNEKSDDESIPMYAVTDTGIYPRDEKFKKKLSKFGSIFKVVRKTDLVFGMSREILNWGILHEDIAGVSSAYTVYEVDAKINSLYLEYYINLQSEYFRDIIRLASREGQGIDRGILQKKELYIPEEQWINRFLDIAYGLLCKADKANAENEQLMAIRDTLLPKLMSGELDISNIDI